MKHRKSIEILPVSNSGNGFPLNIFCSLKYSRYSNNVNIISMENTFVDWKIISGILSIDSIEVRVWYRFHHNVTHTITMDKYFCYEQFITEECETPLYTIRVSDKHAECEQHDKPMYNYGHTIVVLCKWNENKCVKENNKHQPNCLKRSRIRRYDKWTANISIFCVQLTKTSDSLSNWA